MGVSGNFNVRATDVEGVIQGLMKELATLAPNPNRPGHSGPHFITGANDFKPPAEYEGMMGSFMMESMLQTSFMSAALDGIDSVTSYVHERSTTTEARAQTSHARHFNVVAQRTAAMKAYLSDMPQRLKVEACIAQMLRKLYSTRKNAYRLGFGSLSL